MASTPRETSEASKPPDLPKPPDDPPEDPKTPPPSEERLPQPVTDQLFDELHPGPAETYPGERLHDSVEQR